MRGLRQRLGRCRSRRWGKAHRRRNLRCPRPRWPLRILRRERRRRALKTASAGRRIIVGEIRPCRLVAEISGPVLVLLLLQNFPCTVAMDCPANNWNGDKRNEQKRRRTIGQEMVYHRIWGCCLVVQLSVSVFSDSQCMIPSSALVHLPVYVVKFAQRDAVR